MLFLVLLPYAALPLYLLFGTRKLVYTDPASAAAGTVLSADESRWPAQVAAALGQPPPTSYRALRLHADGSQALCALLEVIDGAQHTLELCTFLVARDTVGVAVSAHLAARARAGVRVRLLLDGVGRMLRRRPDLAQLRQAGVQVLHFVPPLHRPLKGRTNLRNHRKLVIADAGRDSERLWCGGRNLAAEYFEGEPGGPVWRDLSFDLQGPLVRQAAALFERDWVFALSAGLRIVRTGEVRAHANPIPAAGPGERAAQLIASGPDQADDTVHALLVSAAYRARARIRLASPYVVLDDALLMALTLAARRGVQVELLLPERSNHRLADFARHRSLRTLASGGVRVWLSPNMLHAKAAIVDDELALAGTTNLDSRSLFLNYELMVAFHEASDIARYAAWFDAERASAAPYALKAPGLWRDLAEGLVLWTAFQI